LLEFLVLVWHVHLQGLRESAMNLPSLGRKIWQTLSSIKTGVVLLIVVVILSAVGTVILQRPVTEPDEMQRAYSPQVLRFFDALGLTDIFHAWWFVALLLLVSLCIVAASIERFPNAWRFFSRPYKYPDENFRRFLPSQKEFAIPDEETGLVAAERALHRVGFKPERVVHESHFSLFAERNRISEMAVYIVHASLLLIFLGGIMDALWGWRGTLNLTEGQTSNLVEMRDGAQKALPFAIRCDRAGQENYADGTPKKWWSKLAVVKDGQDIDRKEIVVNDPLVHGGIRFYQSSFGSTGKVEKLVLAATQTANAAEKKELSLVQDQEVPIDADTTVRLAEFIPDYVVRDGEVYTRSSQVANPAAHLVVTSRKTGQQINYWLPAIEEVAQNAKSPYQFEAQDLKMFHFTGLQVSFEPGQWAVWTGVVLMGIGFAFVFYVAHTRFWAVPVRGASGALTLWVGGTVNRNRDAFQERFREVTEHIERELKSEIETPVSSPQAASVAGRYLN
jgi:cytochrome c biogenesis protein